ncbi:splicing factor 1-like isoform X1 [Oculina patagonica]
MSLTGANTTPMGRLHPILAAKQQGSLNPPTPGIKRDAGNSDFGASERKKKRKSRWGTDEKRTFIPGMPTTMPPNLSPEQQQAYIAQLKIEEITRMLRTGELGIPDNPDERSPSPEPIYNSEGKRLNTREFRVRKKLEEERHVLIQEAMCLNEDYKPPADYKPPIIKIQDKIMIPQDNHPEVNFIGLLIGPRGNTLKKMEKESSAKIMIRGKGSIKEGKIHNGRKDGAANTGEDEELHALVTGPTEQSVQKAVAMIRDILRQGIEAPEGQNDLKRMQLRELAALNGTLRDDEILRCRNCGSVEHRHWECPEQKNVTNNVLCTRCGAAGHLATDCIQTDLPPIPVVQVDKAKMDSEYMSLMAELGEGPVPGPVPEPVPARLPPPPVEQNRQIVTERERPPPRQSTAPLPPPPMQNTNHDRPPSSGPPPWAAPPGPKPLMSTPVPIPGGGPPPPPNSSSAPPWAKPGLLPPPGGPMLGPHPGGPRPPPPPVGPGSYPPQGPGGHGPPPPPPPSSGAPPPPWQSAGPVPPPPWQSQGPGFAPPPPPGFPPFHGPPLPPPSDGHWAPPPLMGALPPPPPPPPPGPPPPSS